MLEIIKRWDAFNSPTRAGYSAHDSFPDFGSIRAMIFFSREKLRNADIQPVTVASKRLLVFVVAHTSD